MTFPLKIVGLLKTKVTQDYIQLTTDQTSLQTVGINLTFASGTLTADWGDGSSTENFVSGVELTHSYAGTGIYNIKISGDLTNITKFIADNSKITDISNFKTGLLTELRLFSNLLTGTLDLSNAPVSGAVELRLNTSLTGISFATSGNSKVTSFSVNGCNLTGVIDLSNVPIGGIFYAYSNSNLTGITFSSSGNTIVSDFRVQSCNLTGTIDLSNVPVGTTFILLNNNPSLTNVIFSSSGNGTHKSTNIYSCDIDYIDLTVGGFSLAVNNASIRVENNSMIVSDVNHILVDLYSLVSAEGAGGDYTGRSINISGTNAAPDGSSGGYDGLTAKTNLEGKGFTVTTS